MGKTRLEKKYKMVKGIDAHYRYNSAYCNKQGKLSKLIDSIIDFFKYNEQGA